MRKLINLTLLVILTLIFNIQAEAKEVKPVFGMYKQNFEDKDELLNQTWTQISLKKEAAKSFPKLNKALIKYNKDHFENAMSRQKKYKSEALSFKQEAPDIFHGFYDRADVIVCRADSVVVSLLEDTADYMGGVHGMYGYFGVNIDTETGKILKISDICNDTDVLVNAILTRLNEDSPRSPFENAKDYITKQINENTIKFTIEPKGVSFYFNPYEIGSYAEGLFTATLLFNEYPNLFKEKYRQIPNAYCQSLPSYQTHIVSLKNGMRDFITISTDDEGYYEVNFNGSIALDRTGMKDVKTVLVHLADGKDYLYADGRIENDKRTLHVYDLNRGKIELIGVLPYTFKNLNSSKCETWWIPTNPDNIQFDSMEPIGNVTSHFGAITSEGTLYFG